MPQEPKRRHSKARKRTRRAAIILKTTAFIKCPNCGADTLAHRVCKSCGFYRGRQITNKVKAKITRA